MLPSLFLSTSSSFLLPGYRTSPFLMAKGIVLTLLYIHLPYVGSVLTNPTSIPISISIISRRILIGRVVVGYPGIEGWKITEFEIWTFFLSLQPYLWGGAAGNGRGKAVRVSGRFFSFLCFSFFFFSANFFSFFCLCFLRWIDHYGFGV